MTYLISVFSVYTKLETLSINILIAVASDFESAIRAGSLAGGWWMSSEGVWLYGGWWNVLNGLALLLAPTFAAALWNKGGWIQNRANTLALWCMFAQVFPLFQDASRFTTVPVIYGEGGIAAAMGSTMPTTANPTAQGMISVISFAVNVFIFAYILKRAKAQKKNPWKEEIFTDTRDYQEAMARAK